jgi:futalosine hydrolase
MKILIVAATSTELKGLFTHYHLPDENFIQLGDFDVLITGVGMTATAFALGKYLHSDYKFVLNVGIAGSFDPSIQLGSLVQIYSDTFSELGAEDHGCFVTIDELGFGNNTFTATKEIPELPKVKGITVNKVHGNAESIAKIKAIFDVQTESMEGAAVFYACAESKIPCAQVRSISNYVKPRAKEEWEMGLAIKNLNEWLLPYLKLSN